MLTLLRIADFFVDFYPHGSPEPSWHSSIMLPGIIILFFIGMLFVSLVGVAILFAFKTVYEKGLAKLAVRDFGETKHEISKKRIRFTVSPILFLLLMVGFIYFGRLLITKDIEPNTGAFAFTAFILFTFPTAILTSVIRIFLEGSADPIGDYERELRSHRRYKDD